ITKRKTFNRQIAKATENAQFVRKFFRLHEIGWHEYQANKYRGLQDNLLNLYTKGEAALYSVAAQNSKNLQTADIGPSLVAQTVAYRAFMTNSLMAKLIIADRNIKDMSPWGRVCDLEPLQCSVATTQVQGGVTPVELAFQGRTQKQFENIFSAGQFAVGPN